MLIITEKIHQILNNKNISENKLANLINYHSGSLNKIIKGQQSVSDSVIEKLSQNLEVSTDEIKGWILADKCSKEVLKLAIEAKNENHENLILTSKIDALLRDKNLSRTSLSKIINYSQGRLNEIIIGKKSMSKTVLAKISNVLEISEDEIKSWILADKYSLKTLKTAII
ncbi:MAG: helix-turn-helix domain-containing protein [Candidatus Gastranaerophilaceae bacterium]|jgi:transcriptional regulator with XRE-family HTH domain